MNHASCPSCGAPLNWRQYLERYRRNIMTLAGEIEAILRTTQAASRR